MSLTGGQREQLDAALRDAFRSYAALGRMVSYKLDRNLRDIAAEAGLFVVVPDLIDAAESEGWTDELVTGALLANPGNPKLRALCEQGVFHPGPVVRRLLDDRTDAAALELLPSGRLLAELPSRQQLETITKAAVGFLDPVPWATTLLEQIRRVCRIEVEGPQPRFGTGFLVGPGLVLTNHHVVEPVVDGTAAREGITCRFDYRVLDATHVDKGTEYGVPEEWLGASGPVSDVDLLPAPAGLPASNELDFALVSLDGRPGDDVLEGGRPRGWMDLTGDFPSLDPGLPIVILQHPAQLHVKVAIDTDGVIEVNGNATRVTYRTNTEQGSSGAPCLTIGLDPVALHHAGEPSFGAGRNEGVPLATIASRLTELGVSVGRVGV
jgi:hypothetical protein